MNKRKLSPIWLLLSLLAPAGLFLCGCATVVDRPEELRSIRREIGRCGDDLNNAVQILTYCARMTPDANLANSALDCVLQIIGEPSPEERVYAASLDLAGCGAILTNAESTISYRAKLLGREQSTEISLSRDYHKFARSASTFNTIKLLSISAIGLFFFFYFSPQASYDKLMDIIVSAATQKRNCSICKIVERFIGEKIQTLLQYAPKAHAKFKGPA